ncbi:hypothetical protein [Streptomyces sp. NPDC002889]|uniref:hypothetical protein n=1 Tax=Streptomyces sp. NPDC002889 TaxID=3364669 RepID=UPI00369CEA06
MPKKGEPRPVELELAGGRAEIIELPGEGGYGWEATAETGVTEKGPEPYGSASEAAAHAGAFLQRHACDLDAAHADCETMIRWAMIGVMVRRLTRGRAATRPGPRPLARWAPGKPAELRASRGTTVPS